MNRIDNQEVDNVGRSTVGLMDKIDAKTFHQDYVKKGKPVVIKGIASSWSAASTWDAEFFSQIEDNINLPVKSGDVSNGEKISMKLNSYASMLIKHSKEKGASKETPLYLHDVPIFNLIPSLLKDVDPFPVDFLPSWYRNDWWKFVQFFMGSEGSFTPLHFDTLYTHNLFFQITGEKKFYLIKPEDRNKCYMNSWRWSDVNLENPNYEKYPLIKEVNIEEVHLGSGDILYMPPGTLHQVHGLTPSVSFNIDWHTKKSVRYGLFSGFIGAPWKNVYYNSLVALGLFFNVSSKRLFKRYQSYLNYVS